MEFDRSVPPPLWEMGYWGITVQRWRDQGMTEFKGDLAGRRLPGKSVAGLPVMTDAAGRDLVGLEPSGERFPGNYWIWPEFEPRILEQRGSWQLMVDEMGVQMEVSLEGSAPRYRSWPVSTREDWEAFKAERFDPGAPGRYPDNMKEVIAGCRDRQVPLGMGTWVGFYGSLRYLLGTERLMTAYYDEPDLIRTMIADLLEFWKQVYAPILERVAVDRFNMWEDMCYNHGPLISPQLFREFMLPAYKELTGFVTGFGVRNVILDTDGDCWKLIPLFVEGGVTGLVPFEVAAGMDVRQVRERYPRLQILGGIDKRAVIKGGGAISQELRARVPVMLKEGGYIPFLDHLVPPDVSLGNFLDYRGQLAELIAGRFGQA